MTLRFFSRKANSSAPSLVGEGWGGVVLALGLLLPLSAMADKQATVTTTNGQTVTLECYGAGVIRVTKTPAGTSYGAKSLSITAQPVDGMKVSRGAKALTAKTSQVVATVDKATGRVSFVAGGKKVLTEGSEAIFEKFNDAGRATYQPEQLFALDKDEAIYGLGILQNGKMNQRGENRTLRTGNTEDGVPFFMSGKGYGVYWDNYSVTHINDGAEGVTLRAEAGDAVDYYFIYGGTANGVIKNIRAVSGQVPMAPLWTYGFHQSRERYKSQEELLEVLHTYRKTGVPIDCMIQDWQYWGSNYLWNAMDFLAETFDNGKGMIDEVHKQNAHLMISVWQSFGPMTKQYRELEPKGLLFNMATWPESGISHVWPPMYEYPSGARVLNVYSPEARDIYWKYLSHLYDLGVDGWWMDSTEPDHHSPKEADYDQPTVLGSYRSVVNAFPLLAVSGVVDHQRAYDKARDQRPFILTRSCSFGQQRTGANTWSGDVGCSFDILRRQVAGGLNFSLTGNPNYNSDLGGFFAGDYNRGYGNKQGFKNPNYKELYLRWMQQGVFTPMMRSHGTDVPREIYLYGKPGEPVYDGLLAAIKLRYALLPYIYSTAWQVSRYDDTFMRALVMDFPKDDKAIALANEYMFGRALLATPVLDKQYTNTDKPDFSALREQKMYLPAGTKWYYFHSGKQYDGGQELTLSTPIAEAPFFVRAGSILPLGPDVQYSTEKAWDNLEVRIYPGANGSFTLYEDQFDGFGYEKGEYTETPMTWNDRARTLTIGARSGSYDGMLQTRTFRLVLPDGTQRAVEYNGSKVSVKL